MTSAERLRKAEFFCFLRGKVGGNILIRFRNAHGVPVKAEYVSKLKGPPTFYFLVACKAELAARMETTLAEPPPFSLTDVDKWVLSQTDEEFHCHDWEELRTIIGRTSSSGAERRN
jgi:hypothetical protein